MIQAWGRNFDADRFVNNLGSGWTTGYFDDGFKTDSSKIHSVAMYSPVEYRTLTIRESLNAIMTFFAGHRELLQQLRTNCEHVRLMLYADVRFVWPEETFKVWQILFDHAFLLDVLPCVTEVSLMTYAQVLDLNSMSSESIAEIDWSRYE